MKKLVVFAAFAVLVSLTQAVYACSCMKNAPPNATLGERIAAEYGAHETIFVGEVVSVKPLIKRGFGLVEVVFRVKRPIKNIGRENLVKVYTENQASACGLEEWLTAKKGDRWLVYTQIVTAIEINGSYLKNYLPKTKEHIYMAWHCSRTAPLEKVAEDMDYYEAHNP